MGSEYDEVSLVGVWPGGVKDPLNFVPSATWGLEGCKLRPARKARGAEDMKQRRGDWTDFRRIPGRRPSGAHDEAPRSVSNEHRGICTVVLAASTNEITG